MEGNALNTIISVKNLGISFGGMGTIEGPIIGAIVFVILRQVLYNWIANEDQSRAPFFVGLIILSHKIVCV